MAVYKDDANLQGLWLMEEVSGTRLDYTANNNDLADNNTVASSSDAQEGGLSADFEGSSLEFLSITDAAQVGLAITGSVSIVLWYKPESLPGVGANQQLVAKYLTTGNQRSYRVIVEENDAIQVWLSSNGTATVSALGATPLTVGAWYHIGVVYNGTDIRIYINGTLDSNGANNPLTYSGGIFDSTANFQIGVQQSGSGYVDGLVDEVAVFNKALSSTEISDIFTNGIQSPMIGAKALANKGSRLKSLVGGALV